jgi:hypothetical protein
MCHRPDRQRGDEMAGPSSGAPQHGMTTHRLEALAHGIFAIAMTLLVLNLALPEAGKGLRQASHTLSMSGVRTAAGYLSTSLRLCG